MKRVTYRVKGMTKEQLRAKYPVKLCIGKNCEREVTVLRHRENDAMAFVRLNWLERIKFEIHKIHTLISNKNCDLKLKRI